MILFDIFRTNKLAEKSYPTNNSISSNGPPNMYNSSASPPNTSPTIMYPTNLYSTDPNYLQMALGAYFTPSASGYKSVDPYFLSQGNKFLMIKFL